jgi:TonB family protein
MTSFVRLSLLIFAISSFTFYPAFSQKDTIINIDKMNIKKSNVYIEVDTMPVLICDYEGNWSERIKKFIGENLDFKNVKFDYEGTVYVQFIVETDGAISRLNIIRGLSKEADREAIRVVSLMDTWEPGIKNNEPVRTLLTVPVKFTH